MFIVFTMFTYITIMIKCFYKVLIISVLCIFLNACTSTKSNKSDKEQEIDGATVVDTAENRSISEEIPSYNDIRNEASELWKILVEKNEENASRILKKVEMIFGRKLKLSEITEDQVDLFYLVLLDMREMANE